MQARVCSNAWTTGWGLMFSRKKNLLMVFPNEKCVGIHCWFVFYPITVYYLDAQKRIIGKKEIRPFREYHFPKPIKYVLESPYPCSFKVGYKLKFNEDEKITTVSVV